MARPTQKKKKSTRASRVKSGIRALWLAACLLVVITPRSLAEITLVSRLSDANAFAQASGGVDAPHRIAVAHCYPDNTGESIPSCVSNVGSGLR